MPRTIIVSNRLPVTVLKKNQTIEYKTSEGGLATGLGSVYKQGANRWIGWPGIYLEEESDQLQVAADLQADHMHPVFLTKTEIKEFYEGFSNETLWPTFHYFLQYTVYDQKMWETYRRVNQKFCNEVMKIAKPGDTIWIHDYQLLLLPQMLRENLPDSSIGFFQHIPFPSYEVFRLLPWREELLNGMLGADLLGFHTYDDARHFLSSVSRIVGFNNQQGLIDTGKRTVMVDAFPMGIDFDKYAEVAESEETLKREQTFRKAIHDQKIILSIDRLDYSKGIPQRLEAYESFLQKYPEFNEKVTLLMIVVPSRDQVGKYKELKEEVDELVGRINGTYGNMNWRPINYFYRSFPLESLSAFYRMADVGLVTPMRDGMNLVAKEYIASKTNQLGVLILSEMAGASRELSDAILINPNDQNQLVNALYEALTMPDEQQQFHMEQMQELVKRYNINHWVNLFMDRLSYIKIKQMAMATTPLDTHESEILHNEYSQAGSRLIFLDYDGTLVGFQDAPQKARPDQELIGLLQKITADHKNRVVIISGRDRKTLQDWLGKLDVDIIAEHGVWLKEGSEDWQMIRNLSSDWKKDIRPMMELHVSRTPGSFIEEKDYSLVWHYRKVEKGLGELRARELNTHLSYLASNINLQVMEGNMVIEIKNTEVNKGAAASRWLEKYPAEFVMAIGDDRTDEDTFRAMPDKAFTIKVGNTRSSARYYLDSVKDVRLLMQEILTDSKANSKLRISA
ncbi:bifunctional alpha,alpha-trehalose-phosphate synthase (UDP-forming)/trehalose-phosphatase [Adhaeribacter sp. BT258]|uniref:Alpha,alpha-trehalose-phosphate synthase n=1 Tax=Adhaeribacter terrigena TaxID=2793070 RepID=A0ABS1C0Q8_9BACT|nr:bifunctional alpha,alpha-trehalose-phosphate synthase (UDP-forming)/trehalose-phosphatase [Adhaeribacter terrigena]MBK0402994.1 bifunctional alpha,alpha-trehalose-phosphate synthase (UDP-forming)/trehalose-phosphatase [Adhaeribacter terrigena]